MNRRSSAISVALALLVVGASLLSPAPARGGTFSSSEGQGRIQSAALTKKSFEASEATKVKLTCKFKPKNEIFSYVLSLKNGKKSQLLRSVTMKGSRAKFTATVKKLFASKPVKPGSYRLKLSADRNSKTLSFKLTSNSETGKGTILFDDFSYTSVDQLEAHGWIVRTKPGWPGVPGAVFSKSNVTFVADPDQAGNRLMRMSSSTDGTPTAGTSQSQVCSRQRKYLAGTYAARVRFRDQPSLGPDGDQVNETFYASGTLTRPFDPNYSELDWEYLPNGGWGVPAPTIWVTSWYTVELTPWYAYRVYTNEVGSLDGWNLLVIQVAHDTVSYYLNGALLASHFGEYYPREKMAINFNLWFINGGMLPPGSVRRYDEDVDWVFHEADVVLSPEQVVAEVEKMRGDGVSFRDTVPAGKPVLKSLCNM